MLEKKNDFTSALIKYRNYRNEHYEIISKLNQLKKEIRFYKQFGALSEIDVIKGLYQSDKDIPDIAEFLGISEYEVYFLLQEKGVISNDYFNL